MSLTNPNVPYTRERFEKAFKSGLFDVGGMETTSWWVGQDNKFWVEYYFDGMYAAYPVAFLKKPK